MLAPGSMPIVHLELAHVQGVLEISPKVSPHSGTFFVGDSSNQDDAKGLIDSRNKTHALQCSGVSTRGFLLFLQKEKVIMSRLFLTRPPVVLAGTSVALLEQEKFSVGIFGRFPRNSHE